ncbi:MAG: baseplate hub protein [Planctomycetota bacterium]|jgi:hypothetical protein
MTNLFNREVRLVLTNRDDPLDVVTIEDPKIPEKEPLKIDFQVEKQLSTEPNRADVDIYNLSDDTAAKINFRKPVLEFKYGRRIDIFAGYEGQARKIFSGVVISAITSKEGPLKITRIECRNIFYELMRLPVNITAAKGELKSNAVLNVLSVIGAVVDGKAKANLINRLSGETFTDTMTLTGTAYEIIDKINRGLLGVINVYFDDIGTSFNPVGIPNDEPAAFYSQENGLIGTPKPTEIGADFIVQLDNELRLGSPVDIDSPTIRSFFALGKFVTKKIIHAGTNDAEGDFQTRVTSVFNRSALGADLIPTSAVA